MIGETLSHYRVTAALGAGGRGEVYRATDSDYAVSADGRRFLVKRPLEDASRQRIHVMLDWPSLLE